MTPKESNVEKMKRRRKLRKKKKRERGRKREQSKWLRMIISQVIG
jgi:hypothetical protein